MDRFGHPGPVGGRHGNSGGKHPQKLRVIKAKDFGQTAQSDPVPLVWGSARRAGIFIFPIFKLRTKKVAQSAGGK
jgi:hypothetical protein